MLNKECRVCGRLGSNNYKVNPYEYCVIEWGGVCPKCASVLGKATTLFASSMKNMHHNERARLVDNLLYTLNIKGFPPWEDK